MAAVPVGVNVKIVPLPSTLSTVIVQSFAGVAPPKSVPTITIVSFVTKLAPALFINAVYVVPVRVTSKVALVPLALAVPLTAV